MARDTGPATAGDTTPRNLGATDSNSDGIGSDAMAGQSHAWQELREEEADDMARKPSRTTDASGSDNGSGSGVAAAKRGSGDAIAIELETVETQATGSAPAQNAALGSGAGAEADRDGAAAEAAAVGVEYKVYKRRWFGLVQLTLLNIVVSWDVSSVCFVLSSLRFSYWSQVQACHVSSAAAEVRGIRMVMRSDPLGRRAGSLVLLFPELLLSSSFVFISFFSLPFSLVVGWILGPVPAKCRGPSGLRL